MTPGFGARQILVTEDLADRLPRRVVNRLDELEAMFAIVDLEWADGVPLDQIRQATKTMAKAEAARSSRPCIRWPPLDPQQPSREADLHPHRQLWVKVDEPSHCVRELAAEVAWRSSYRSATIASSAADAVQRHPR